MNLKDYVGKTVVFVDDQGEEHEKKLRYNKAAFVGFYVGHIGEVVPVRVCGDGKLRKRELLV